MKKLLNSLWNFYSYGVGVILIIYLVLILIFGGEVRVIINWHSWSDLKTNFKRSAKLDSLDAHFHTNLWFRTKYYDSCTLYTKHKDTTKTKRCLTKMRYYDSILKKDHLEMQKVVKEIKK